MPEHSLEELEQLCQPALRHAELVEIARTQAPNKAQQLALTRWPVRQAKATRFLAMVVRDYGVGAFDALVSSLEHARPMGSEHAQEVSMLDGLYPDNVQNVVVHQPVYGCEVKDFCLLHIAENQQLRSFKLEEEFARLGLDDAGKKRLVRNVTNGMLMHWAKPDVRQLGYGEMWTAARLAAKFFLPEDKELEKQLLLATISYGGGATKYPQGLMHAMVERGESKGIDTLQGVIDRALSLGCTKEEVLCAWGVLLLVRYNHNFHTGAIYEFVGKLKVGETLVSKKFESVARLCLVRELKGLLVTGTSDSGWQPTMADEGWFLMMDEIVAAVDCNWRRNQFAEQFEDMLVHCLARGATTTAVYLIMRYGEDLGLWSESGGDCAQHAGPKGFEKLMEKLLRVAKDKAEHDLKQFGVACALAEHIGDIAESDRLRAIARNAKQAVALNCTFYYRRQKWYEKK